MIGRLLLNQMLNRSLSSSLNRSLFPQFTFKMARRFSSSTAQNQTSFSKMVKNTQDHKTSQASESLSKLIQFSSISHQKEAIKAILNMAFSNKLPKELENDEKLLRLLETDPKSYIAYLLFDIRNEINALKRANSNDNADLQGKIKKIDTYLQQCKQKLAFFAGSEDYQNLNIKIQLADADYQSFVASISEESSQILLLEKVKSFYEDLKTKIPQQIQTQKLKLMAKHEEPFSSNQTFEDRRAQMEIMRQQPCLLIEMLSHTILNNNQVTSKLNFITKKQFTPQQITQQKQSIIEDIKKAITFYETFKTTTSSQVYHKLKMAVIEFDFDIKLAAIQNKLRENMNYNVTNDVEEYKKEFIQEMEKYYQETVDDLQIIQISGGKNSYNSALAVCHTLLHLSELLSLKLKSNDKQMFQKKMKEEKDKILTFLFKEEDKLTISERLDEQLAHILQKAA